MKGERALMSRGTKRVLNEPLPPAVAILRRNRYNWAPRSRRLGHCSRIRGTSEGRSIVVCIRDGDRYRRRGRELWVRVDFFRDDLTTIIAIVYFPRDSRTRTINRRQTPGFDISLITLNYK